MNFGSVEVWCETCGCFMDHEARPVKGTGERRVLGWDVCCKRCEHVTMTYRRHQK